MMRNIYKEGRMSILIHASLYFLLFLNINSCTSIPGSYLKHYMKNNDYESASRVITNDRSYFEKNDRYKKGNKASCRCT